MSTQATFEATVEGRGKLPNIDVPIERIANGVLRHSALSNIDIEASGMPEDIRRYSTFFAPFELRVAFPNDSSRSSERIFKGRLVEVEQSGSSAITTLRTVGRLIKLEKSDGFREFADIRAYEALRTYIQEETPFGVVVEDDPGTVVVDDGVAFEADTQTDYDELLAGAIPDDKPIDYRDGRLIPLQSSFLFEAEAGNGATPISGSDYSGGDAAQFSFGGATSNGHTISLDYRIPSGDASIVVRGERPGTFVTTDITIDGNTVETNYTVPSTLSWGQTAVDFELTPGNHTIDIEANTVSDDDPDSRYDVVGLVDSRYNYTFDNSVHEPSGYLDGPEPYPDAVAFEWPVIDQETQVSACRITSSWDDTTDTQQVAASPNAGSEYLTADNSETLDVDFEAQDIIGTDLQIRTTHGRHSPNGPRDQTPRLGYEGQSIGDIEVRFDQISVAIIGPSGTLFAENDLQNIKDLASLARYNFVVDHAGDDDVIEAFPVGFENPDGADWMTVDWDRADGDRDYANRVVARGASKPEEERESPDDLRYEAAVRDEDEITRLTNLGLTEDEAEQTTTVTDPELSGDAEVQAQAFNELEEVVGLRLPSGSIDIVPAFIPPGYAYPVNEFETVDGETPSKVLEKVTYSEGYGQDARGGLEFETPQNWVSGLSPVEKDVIGIKRLF